MRVCTIMYGPIRPTRRAEAEEAAAACTTGSRTLNRACACARASTHAGARACAHACAHPRAPAPAPAPAVPHMRLRLLWRPSRPRLHVTLARAKRSLML